jgi:hypothetical protein
VQFQSIGPGSVQNTVRRGLSDPAETGLMDIVQIERGFNETDIFSIVRAGHVAVNGGLP